jgi:hypothetical protein
MIFADKAASLSLELGPTRDDLSYLINTGMFEALTPSVNVKKTVFLNPEL